MTIDQAINTLDARRSNTFSRQEKIGWLSQLDKLICEEVISTHQGEAISFVGYTADTDPQTRLLVPAPWDEIYLHYMQAQIDYINGEMTRYTNAAALFNNVLSAYKNHYHRSHAPKGQAWRYF